jgi:hypothetical protein
LLAGRATTAFEMVDANGGKRLSESWRLLIKVIN